MYILVYRIMHKHTTKCSNRYCCCSGKPAWKEEFWPTTAAEYVLHLLWTLSKRALWLSEPELRQAYVSDVPKVSMDVCDADPLCNVQAFRQYNMCAFSKASKLHMLSSVSVPL